MILETSESSNLIGSKYILRMQEGREEGKQSQVTHKSVYIQVIIAIVIFFFLCVVCLVVCVTFEGQCGFLVFRISSFGVCVCVGGVGGGGGFVIFAGGVYRDA